MKGGKSTEAVIILSKCRALNVHVVLALAGQNMLKPGTNMNEKPWGVGGGGGGGSGEIVQSAENSSVVFFGPPMFAVFRIKCMKKDPPRHNETQRNLLALALQTRGGEELCTHTWISPAGYDCARASHKTKSHDKSFEFQIPVGDKTGKRTWKNGNRTMILLLRSNNASLVTHTCIKTCRFPAAFPPLFTLYHLPIISLAGTLLR